MSLTLLFPHDCDNQGKDGSKRYNERGYEKIKHSSRISVHSIDASLESAWDKLNKAKFDE